MKYHVFAPYLRDKTRLTLMDSGKPFGMMEGDHIMDRLNSYVESVGNPKPYQGYNLFRSIPYPDLRRERPFHEQNILSDLLYNDTFRQLRGIEEKYRYNLPNVADMRKLGDPSTRYHRSISRGLERKLVDDINGLDTEMLTRQSIIA